MGLGRPGTWAHPNPDVLTANTILALKGLVLLPGTTSGA
eukprot:CAMPEP_0202916858 /NCGR_PEP_ID=MMETSP1392-20130828/69628_1 /ASSEMBLY_ACC=CAM_ASM_000868 /TAXON_ID=225041 /ORGANISM="Chlamydomonas chlamydogama, Strain SAG 11-48b" /LENGTH=38 /DNA_ID= /DNA_START= /DNA_END= /DNA_ORIENTATION=